LTRNFRNLEQFEDEDDCYYQYRKEKQARNTKAIPRLLDRLVWLSCGYGVRPDYTVAWSFSIIIIFGAVFYLGKGLLQSERRDAENGMVAEPSGAGGEDWSLEVEPGGIGEDPPPRAARHRHDLGGASSGPEHPSFGEAMYFSSLVFIAQAPAYYQALGRYKYLVIAEGILGWLMLALFLVGLGKVMIR